MQRLSRKLKTLLWLAAVTAYASLPTWASPQAPLQIQAQGSFFVGGVSKPVQAPATAIVPAQNGTLTADQMYVQYQVPVTSKHYSPVVMIHGCCLSSKTWETTPDGRPGWSEYFLRHDRAVYLAEQASRGRSGFDPSAFYDIQVGTKAPAQMPSILTSTHELSWTMFRFGPKVGEVFPDEQFPMQAVEEFYKQLIPDLNATLPPTLNPTWTDLATLGVQLKGAVLIGHSEAGFFPEQAALIDSKGIRGIVSIETQCDAELPPAQIAQLAKIPTLILFGDHLNDVNLTFEFKPWTWQDMLVLCSTFVDQLKKAGGDAQVMHLPALGIKGNSHMLMQDRNSDRVADLVTTWIDAHVDSQVTPRSTP